MKKIRLIMDMPVIVEIASEIRPEIFEKIFDYFHCVDNTFSTFKKTSEITKINLGLLSKNGYSRDMQEILRLAQNTKEQTSGYFDIRRGPSIDPAGIVKGWAIRNAALMLKNIGYKNYYVEAGGDIEVSGNNKDGKNWIIGIRNPFHTSEIIKRVTLKNMGIATSGIYERGKHIYNPKTGYPVDEIVSLTVIGPDVYEADRFATAAFAMGKMGIDFIEHQKNLEGYMIDTQGIATLTSGFAKYTI